MLKLSVLLLIIALAQTTVQDSYEENEIDTDGFENIISTFLLSKSGQELGKTLLTMGAGGNANQILDGIGAILGNGGEGSGKIDPTFLSSALNLLVMNKDAIGKNEEQSPILSWVVELFAKEGGLQNLMSFLPTALSSINSFIDEEGKGDKSGSDWILPPIIEKVQEFATLFMNSELAHTLTAILKDMEVYKMVVDKRGKINVEKIFALLENHSFRKQGIEIITERIGAIASRLFDPSLREMILTTLESNINQMLRDRDFPQSAVFDRQNPIDSISAICNYGFKKTFGYQIRSKQYVKPAFKYLKSIYINIQTKGYFTGKKMNANDLSNNLADIINLEIIEPFIRVFRAYRFAKKHTKCDKYVVCLLNKDVVDESVSLPIIKKWLTKGANLIGSWFISNHTGTSYWTFYSYIMDDMDCKKVHFKSCDTFHEEEMIATTKPVHTEL
ncbi:hypothetical protein RI129_005746 [Pyrocoelia pectoralis]|uniref:Uncharacterized protein n=1 Tax=Pyrocoelia pectoralis TaxID=417401 RepID=A0AAN7VG13_9COLE